MDSQFFKKQRIGETDFTNVPRKKKSRYMTVLNIEKTMDSRHKGDNLVIVP